MTLRLRATALIGALAFGLLVGSASGASAAPDVTSSWLQAVNRVDAAQPELARQQVYLASGFTRGTDCFDLCKPGRYTKSASGIVLWFFDFRDQLTQPQTVFGHIAYGPLPKGFSTPTTRDGASGPEAPMGHPPQMTLRQAVAILEEHRRAAATASVQPGGTSVSSTVSHGAALSAA